MQDETWPIAVGANSETNHQHCFYETSVTLVILTMSPPSGSHLTFVILKCRSQQYSQPLISAWAFLTFLQVCALTPVFSLSSHNRTNLDPWDQYSDAQIWEALEKTHIKEMVSGCNCGNWEYASLPPHPPLSSHLCVTSRRWASCLTRCSRRWRRTEKTSLWGNGSFSVWPEPCCATARC